MDIIRYSCTCINHVLIFGVTLAMCWKCLQLKLVKTAMHAFLCTLGFVLLFAEGMLVRYRGNPLTITLSASEKNTLHLWLQLIGGLLGIIGTIQKVVGKSQHFRTLHGKLGLAACVFCAVNFLSGFLSLYSPQFSQYISPLFNRFVHNFLGLVTFITAMAAQYYGYETGFFRRNFVNQQQPYKILTIVICCLSILGPVQLLFAKLANLVWY